jgi:hypothetical protein
MITMSGEKPMDDDTEALCFDFQQNFLLLISLSMKCTTCLNFGNITVVFKAAKNKDEICSCNRNCKETGMSVR